MNTDNNMESVIKTESLSKIYEGIVPVKAVNDVNLDIKKGEFIALVGPSGSGKTTLLNLIGGLDTPTNGSVWINEHDITQLSKNQLIEN